MLGTATAPQLTHRRTHAEVYYRTIGPQREEDEYYKRTPTTIYATKTLFDKEDRCRFLTVGGETIFWCKMQKHRCFFDKKEIQDRDGKVILTLQKKIAHFVNRSYARRLQENVLRSTLQGDLQTRSVFRTLPVRRTWT